MAFQKGNKWAFKKGNKWAFKKGNKLGYKHGGCGSRLYSVWECMNSRARHLRSMMKQPKKACYAHCTICEEWRTSFLAFAWWAYMEAVPPYADNLTIDRIDNEKGYSPDNCRWATYSEQNRNRRMTEKRLAANRRNAAKGREVIKRKREERRKKGIV